MREVDPEEAQRRAAGSGPSRSPPRALRGTFRVGSVLPRAVSIYGRNALPFCVISLVLHLPLFAYLTYGGRLYRPSPGERPELGALLTAPEGVSAWGGLLSSLLVTGPLAFGVFEQLRGRPASLGACVLAGVRTVPRAVGVAILLAFMLAGVAVAGVFALIPVALVARAGPGSSVLMAWGLLVALAFGGGAVLARHALAVPASVVERLGAGMALIRSRALTRGNAWRTFAVWILIQLPAFGASWLLAMVTGGTLGPRPRFALLVEDLVSAGVWRPLFAVALAICYHDLRVSAEGVDPEDLVRVFE
jgi:hypothetical protein